MNTVITNTNIIMYSYIFILSFPFITFLVVMLWEKQKGFEHNVGLGGAEIAFNRIKLTQTTLGWYPLYPIQTLGSDSNDSP